MASTAWFLVLSHSGYSLNKEDEYKISIKFESCIVQFRCKSDPNVFRTPKIGIIHATVHNCDTHGTN